MWKARRKRPLSTTSWRRTCTATATLTSPHGSSAKRGPGHAVAGSWRGQPRSETSCGTCVVIRRASIRRSWTSTPCRSTATRVGPEEPKRKKPLSPREARSSNGQSSLTCDKLSVETPTSADSSLTSWFTNSRPCNFATATPLRRPSANPRWSPTYSRFGTPLRLPSTSTTRPTRHHQSGSFGFARATTSEQTGRVPCGGSASTA